jgi:hypothetical protein
LNSAGFAQAIGIEHGHAGLVFLELHLGEHGFLGFLQQAVDPAEDEHRQDDIAVFPANEDVAEAVVRDGPDEGDDFVVGGVIHVGGEEQVKWWEPGIRVSLTEH